MNASSPFYGKIIDPYEGIEIQHSTPTFAHAATTLLVHGYYTVTIAERLLADTELAIDVSLTALAFGQPKKDQGCAQGALCGALLPRRCTHPPHARRPPGPLPLPPLSGHCNFYTMPLMLAIQQLQASNMSAPARIAKWAAIASTIQFTRSYRGKNGWTPGNWGIVAMTGTGSVGSSRSALLLRCAADLTWCRLRQASTLVGPWAPHSEGT
jgi:hypothetical protein